MKARPNVARALRAGTSRGMLRRRLMRTLPLSTILLLAACDRGGNSDAPAQLTPGVRIDATNAIAVASAAYRTAFEPLRAARIAASFLEVEPTGDAVRDLPGPEGGSALFTWDDLDGDAGYSSGDAFTIVFDDYAADGRVLAGAAVLGEVTTAGNVPAGFTWTVHARLELIGVQLAIGGGAPTTLDGALRLRRERRVTVSLLDVENESELPFGSARVLAGATASRNDYTLDFSTGLFADGSLDDALLGGRLSFASTGALRGIPVIADPGAGEFVVGGAAGSSLTLVPVDWFNAELHVDADGDGLAETIVPIDYASL